VPPLPHDDSVSLTDRKLHHCYFCYIEFVPFVIVYIFLILNIQDRVQHSLSVYINCGKFFGHMYIIVVMYRTLCFEPENQHC